MSQIAINPANETETQTLPVFEEMAKRFQAIQRRAFDLFEKRGGELGHDLEDWLNAEQELLGWPAAELVEQDQVYHVDMTLSGFAPKDIEVTAGPHQVIVHAKAHEEKSTGTESVLWTEFGSNDIYRSFGLPAEIDTGKVTASLENGLLRITAPKMAGPKTVEQKHQTKAA